MMPDPPDPPDLRPVLLTTARRAELDALMDRLWHTRSFDDQLEMSRHIHAFTGLFDALRKVER